MKVAVMDNTKCSSVTSRIIQAVSFLCLCCVFPPPYLSCPPPPAVKVQKVTSAGVTPRTTDTPNAGCRIGELFRQKNNNKKRAELNSPYYLYFKQSGQHLRSIYSKTLRNWNSSFKYESSSWECFQNVCNTIFIFKNISFHIFGWITSVQKRFKTGKQ